MTRPPANRDVGGRCHSPGRPLTWGDIAGEQARFTCRSSAPRRAPKTASRSGHNGRYDGRPHRYPKGIPQAIVSAGSPLLTVRTAVQQTGRVLPRRGKRRHRHRWRSDGDKARSGGTSRPTPGSRWSSTTWPASGHGGSAASRFAAGPRPWTDWKHPSPVSHVRRFGSVPTADRVVGTRGLGGRRGS